MTGSRASNATEEDLTDVDFSEDPAAANTADFSDATGPEDLSSLVFSPFEKMAEAASSTSVIKEAFKNFKNFFTRKKSVPTMPAPDESAEESQGSLSLRGDNTPLAAPKREKSTVWSKIAGLFSRSKPKEPEYNPLISDATEDATEDLTDRTDLTGSFGLGSRG